MKIKNIWKLFATVIFISLMVLLITQSQTIAASESLAQEEVKSSSVDVEPELLAQFETQQQAGYLIYFRKKADLSEANKLDWEARGYYVMETLQATARTAQANVVAYLDKEGVEYQSFWIDNIIVVDSSTQSTMQGLLAFNEIESIRARRTMQVIEPVQSIPDSNTPNAIEPNIEHVLADDVWALGYLGEGTVVANIDTGARYTHEALNPQYRGNLGGGTYDHNYSWWDPYGDHPTAPGDDNGHGSHTMGTMIGDDGDANQIGMAPDSEWMACRGCDTNNCTDTALLECAQWIAAPWDLSEQNPDPAMRPYVVNNSWGDCDTSYDNWYQGVVDAWHAAGVYPVFSNGNAGNCGYSYPPGLNTVGNPARYGNVTGVGSTGTSDGAYATHSNWGPTDNDDTVNPTLGWEDLKPQVLAPGVAIRSSVNSGDSAYSSYSGTSMSAPHVAGLIALMWEAAPCLVGDYATTETIIEDTATPIAYDDGTGGGAAVPNYATGWGEINALAAVEAASMSCGPNFTIDADPEFLSVCTPDDAVYDVMVGSLLGFTDPVDLSAMGEPSGATATFGDDPVTPPFTTTLTIGNMGGATAGEYGIDIVGVSTTRTHTATVGLDVYTAVPAAPTLSAPANGATEVDLTPTFTWSSVSQAETYFLEVATDMAFTNVVYSATVDTTSHTMAGMNLEPETMHYWRVMTMNACGNSAYSATYSFTTVLLFCSYPDLPILDNTTVSDSLTSSRYEALADLNVYMLIDHTWTGDLDINLTHEETGASVVLLSTAFSCSTDNIDATFDDEATDPITCATSAPAIGGDVQPDGMLADFDFVQLAGTWRLDVTDGVGGDQGTLVQWCLEPRFASSAGNIEGAVTDSNTGDGIAGATVTLDDGSGMYTAVTDANGDYARLAAPGTYTVTAAQTNYVTGMATGVMVTDGVTTTQDFSLDAGWLSSVATGFAETVELGNAVTNTWTLENVGTADLEFVIRRTDNGYNPSQNVILDGEDILVVNDGGFNTDPVAAFTTALDNLGYTYATVDSSEFITMAVADLLDYQAVIYAGTVSSGDEQTQAIAYMDAGGRFLAADNDIGYFASGSAFYNDYLQSYYVSDGGSSGVLTGADIMSGITPDISTDPYPDDFTAGAEGVGIFTAPSGNLAGIRVERMGYKAIYFAWDYDNIGTDGAGDADETTILDAALGWLVDSGDFWLYTDIVTGTIAAGGDQDVTVTMDAGLVALAGAYYADLVVQNDTPYGDLIVPVTMTVECPTCGALQGDITDTLTGSPLTSTVQITSASGFDYTFEDVTAYSIAVPPETYYLTVSAFDYYSQTATSTVSTGVTNTVDFALTPIFATLEYSPDFIEEYMEIGDAVTNTVTITNNGTADLDFNVNIGNFDGPGTLSIQKVESSALSEAASTAARVEPIVTSPEECAAYENYAGREPQGFAEFCKVDTSALDGLALADIQAPTDTGYAQDIGFISENFVSFTLNDFPGQTVVGTTTDAYYGMDFDPSANTLYALNDTTGELGTIDTATGAFTALVAAPAPGGSWTGLSIDPTDGAFYASTATDLYTLDPATGVSTLVGSYTNTTLMIDIAVGPDGAMYGHAIDTDAIYAIDKTTGADTLVGSTGFDANFAQGMDFDNDDGTLYIFLYIGSGANVYGTVDLTTGAVTALATDNPQGEFEGAVAVPGSGGSTDWAYATIGGDVVVPGETATFEVVFDATGVQLPGTYSADLTFSGNFENSVDPMPLTMHITCPTCGTLNGSITDYNTGDPLVADVHVQGEDYDVTVNDDTYSLLAPEGTYTITASATDYISQTAVVAVTQGMTVTTDFALRPNQPLISVTPQSFDVELGMGSLATYTLDIINQGARGASFEIREDPGPSVQILTPPTAQPVVSRGDNLRIPLFNAPGGQNNTPFADVIQDGGFEAGPGGGYWNEYSLNFGTPVCDAGTCGTGTGTGPYSGVYWTWFGGVGAYEEGSMDQDVLIPNGTAELSFWLEQITCDSAADYMQVLIDGVEVFASYGDSPLCGVLGYSQVVVDVSSFADGGVHNVEFYSETFANNGSGSNFFVDDVVLDVTEGSSDVPWLATDPITGTVSADDMFTVDVIFDTTVLTETGVYTAFLHVLTADPINPAIEAPITLTISAPEASLMLDVTVSDVNECGAADSLVVDPGSVVYFCYTATNMGNVMLPEHTITDTVTGHIDSFVFDLMPGMTESVIYTKTVDMDMSMTVMWMAENPDMGMETMGTDTVEVTLTTRYIYLPVVMRP